MTKTIINTMIHNMKLANMVTKATPWMVEGIGERQMNVRYVGIVIKDDWLTIMSEKNHIMMKFLFDNKSASIECYLANNPPFIRIKSTNLQASDKWETLLGELKRQLKKDKVAFINHTDVVGNLYAMISPQIK